MQVSRVLTQSLFLLALGILASCGSNAVPLHPKSRELATAAADRKEERKEWSGRSLAAETEVVLTSSQSAAAPGFDSERVWSGADDWEPVVAADPHAPYVYQLTTRFAGPRPKIAFRRSSDQGASFDIDTLIPDTGKDQNDPQIAVADDGTIYVAWLDVWQTLLIKSFDHGVSWTAPVNTITGPPFNSDHGWLAISSDGKDVYVGFNWSDSYVAASHDFGQSFSPPVKTNSDSRTWFHSGAVVVPTGEVYIGAVDFRATLAGPSHINVLRSANGGISWSEQRIDTSRESPDCAWAAGCYLGFLAPFTGIAADRAGRLMLVYNANVEDGQPQQVWARTSRDGMNWSPRRVISPLVISTNHCFPSVVAGSVPGDFRVVWQSDDNGNVKAWNTWYRQTQDGGETWGPILRLSDRARGAPYKSRDGYLFPYGDYSGIAISNDGMAHVIWGEGLSWTGPGGTWYARGQ